MRIKNICSVFFFVFRLDKTPISFVILAKHFDKENRKEEQEQKKSSGNSNSKIYYKTQSIERKKGNIYWRVLVSFSEMIQLLSFATKIFQISEFVITTGCTHFPLYYRHSVSSDFMLSMYTFFFLLLSFFCLFIRNM